jgi:xanthine dehydrogenase accessory factor
LPVLRLVVVGSTPAARTAVRLAHAMGYRADVVDPEARTGDFPGAARVLARLAPDTVERGAHILVATMDERDFETIEAALRLQPAYLGVIASRKRFAELRDALAARGVERAVLDTIAAPAGIDIGAQTPEEIALSVMAQIIERRRHGAGKHAEGNTQAAAETKREAIDPVCGMTVAITGARHIAEVDGRSFYFCSDGCRTMFLADPALYRAKTAPAAATVGMVAVSRSRG